MSAGLLCPHFLRQGVGEVSLGLAGYSQFPDDRSQSWYDLLEGDVLPVLYQTPTLFGISLVVSEPLFKTGFPSLSGLVIALQASPCRALMGCDGCLLLVVLAV